MSNVIRSCSVSGFHIVLIIADAQFKTFKDRNMVVDPFNVVSMEEHINAIELYHRVIKERDMLL